MLLFPENQPGLEQGSHPEGSNQSFWPVSGTQPMSSAVTGDTKGPRKAWTTPSIYCKRCFEHEPGQSSASGGRAKNPSLSTWNVTSLSSSFLLEEILLADGAVTNPSCTTPLLSRWIYCCRETVLLPRFGNEVRSPHQHVEWFCSTSIQCQDVKTPHP